MNVNEEGKYYASMVRKFRTEYKGKDLPGFCRNHQLSYTKMLHCLRSDSYRKPKATVAESILEQGLHPKGCWITFLDNIFLDFASLESYWCITYCHRKFFL